MFSHDNMFLYGAIKAVCQFDRVGQGFVGLACEGLYALGKS